jgi:hypothetical protein
MEQSIYKKDFMKHFRTRYGFAMVSLFALFAFVLSSCETNKIYEEYYVNTVTLKYTVEAKDWIRDSDVTGGYFYYTFSEPALTKDIFEFGMVTAFLSFDRDNVLTPLPFSDSWIGDGGYKWTEELTYEFRPGYVTFIFKANDHATDQPTYSYDFVIKMMW